MIAYTQRHVEALNLAARRMLDERGRLGRERVTYGGREWAVGDELIATRNRRQLGLTNGTRGTVQRVGRDGLDIRTSSRMARPCMCPATTSSAATQPTPTPPPATRPKA